jgi:hypothetical protein
MSTGPGRPISPQPPGHTFKANLRDGTPVLIRPVGPEDKRLRPAPSS